MLVPIRSAREVTGVLLAGSPRPFALGEADRVVLATLADQAAVALESTRLLSSTQQAALRMSSLNELGRRVAAQLELQEMLGTTVSALEEYLAFYRVGIFCWTNLRQSCILGLLMKHSERSFPLATVQRSVRE